MRATLVGTGSHGEEKCVGVRVSASVTQRRRNSVGRDEVWPECCPLHTPLHLLVFSIMMCSRQQQQRGQCQPLTFS